MILPEHSETRKTYPVYTGVMRYFPLALLEVANLSFVGAKKHSPDSSVRWVRGKSGDHLDCLLRHLAEHSSGIEYDTDGVRQLAKVAWRALAQLQTVIEEEQSGRI